MDKNVGKSCKICGQVFDPSIAFCPTDGAKLSAELIIANSHELIQVTSRHLVNKNDAQSGQIVLEKVKVNTINDDGTCEGAPAQIKSDAGGAAPQMQSHGGVSDKIAGRADGGNNGDTVTGKSADNLTGTNGNIVTGTDNSAANAASGGARDPKLASTVVSDPDQSSHADKMREDRGHLVPTLLGQTLDNQYEILSVVGKGGMSFVYKAQHLLLRKTVAIKTLLPHLTVQATSLQRFQQEAQAASNLKHPNIILIHNFGTTPDGEPYLVMDFVEGPSIAEELEKYGFVQVDRAVDIFIQVADALAHAHQRGIIHRDLKPSNILLLEKEGRKDFVNIVDFGIAKMLPQDGQEGINLTQTGEVFGSPLYMSPEQCRGDKLDTRADIYSMGCLMYETLTGRPAVAGENTMEVLYNHLHDVPAPMKAPLTHIPAQLEKIVFKTLAKDPAQRYQTMDLLKEDLLAFRLHRKTSIISKLVNAWELFWLRRKPRTKRDKIIVAIAISGFLVAGALAFQLASLYWAAADSPASKVPMVWDEDKEAQKPVVENFEDGKARFDLMVHNRVAASMEDEGKPSSEIVDYLSSEAEYLTKRKLWKSALEMYQAAFKYSLKYNDYLALRTMHLRMSEADCYIRLHQYEQATHILNEMLGKIQHEAPNDLVDHSIISAKLGNVLYLGGKWQPALNYMTSAYKIWISKINPVPFTFYTVPAHLESSYDYTMLVSRIASAYQRLYEDSVSEAKADRVLLSNSVVFYKLASEQWVHLAGEHENNHNGIVASANFLYLDHILDPNADLDKGYAQLVERSSHFKTESADEGIVLRNYSDYLIDKGHYIEAAINRVHTWRIFAQLAKAEAAGEREDVSVPSAADKETQEKH